MMPSADSRGLDSSDFGAPIGLGAQPGFPMTPLHNGARFTGYQHNKGNRYQVEVSLKVGGSGLV